MMEFDENEDGKLSQDELPERFQSMMTRADRDNDGLLTKEELTTMAERQAGQNREGRGARGGRGGEGRPQRPRPDEPGDAPRRQQRPDDDN
jgi:Ca2+-binding EF-hand superfamily protein